jgi:phosphoglycerol transferase MdoB-like AlkP superfamily enzyme
MTHPLSRPARLSIPIWSTASFYALYYAISALGFSVAIKPAAVPFDYALQLLVAYGLFALSRKVTVFLVIQGLLMAVLYVGNAVKISFFGGPIVPDDVYALQSLLLLLEGWQFLLAAGPLALVVSLVLFNFTLRAWHAWLACLGFILFGITLVYQPALLVKPLDKRFGNVVWDQRSNYLSRGASIYSLQEGARFFADQEIPPEQDAALAAARALRDPATPREPREFTPRNVHIILLESFWDPSVLKAASYNRDPLAPGFRKLWKATGDSTGMSPVFGGYTANAEFEVLCGFPVVENSVKFERRLTNSVPCLPHLLAERGYRAVASHPNVPVFWNRTNAYRRVGFDSFWSQEHFVRDDMVKEFLTDSSLYRQVLEKISPELDGGKPIINYIVTYFGHWNFPLNEARPQLITSPSPIPEVTNYANNAYYKSKELVEFIDALQKRDPDSIIVAFGDHLPFLGWSFEGYLESEFLGKVVAEYPPDMLRDYVSTPLIFIDGRNGPLKLGSLPLYQLPALILERLGDDRPTMMDYTRPPAGMRIRPLPNQHFDLLDDGTVAVCRGEAVPQGACIESERWLKNVLTVGIDLFTGKQHSLP